MLATGLWLKFVWSPELPSLIHTALQWKHCRCVWQISNTFLINSCDLPGIPREPNLVSVLSWTLALLTTVTDLMNNIGAFTSILSEFSAGCAGKERHLLWYGDSSQCMCCIGDSTANKRGFDCDVTCFLCTSHQHSMHASYEITRIRIWKDPGF